MFALPSSELVVVDGNALNNRPPITGTAITPGASNVKGSWTQLIASTVTDTHGILLALGGDTGASRSKLVDIGIGGAGSETVWIPDLAVGPCQGIHVVTSGQAAVYFFPLKLKAGTRVSARASVNNATAGTMNCCVAWLLKARFPDRFRTGSRVVAYGVDSANSRGTAVTEGTISDGTFASIGTIAAGDYPWYWELGISVDAATLTARQHSADMAIGSAVGTNRMVIEDKLFACSTTPQIGYCGGSWGRYANGYPGENIYTRQQCSSTAETGYGHIAYGVI